MAQYVGTRQKRFTFVEKLASEVGDGTAYPMLVTPDQLAEIGYRVKDSEITSGAIAVSFYEGVDVFNFFIGGGGKPSALFTAYVGDEIITMRGYCAISNDVSPDGPLSAYAVPLFGAPYYNYLSTSGYDVAARDIGENEMAMWAAAGTGASTIGRFWGGTVDIDFTALVVEPSPFRTGLSHYSSNSYGQSASSAYGIYADLNTVELTSAAGLEFSGEVAFVDDTGSGNPFDSGNRLFIGLDFTIALGDYYLGQALHISSNESLGHGIPQLISPRLVLTLSGVSNTVSCPLYVYPDPISSMNYDDTTGSDFVFTAKEWWQYSKDSPAVPVWDSTTGLPL